LFLVAEKGRTFFPLVKREIFQYYPPVVVFLGGLWPIVRGGPK
jgi:hypothetical protein